MRRLIATDPSTLATVAALLCAAGLARSAAAQTTAHWIGVTNGNWFDAARWDTGVPPMNENPPGATYRAVFAATGANYTVTLANATTLADLSVASSNATLSHTGGVLTVNGELAVTSGLYRLNGGTLRNAVLRPGLLGLAITPNQNNVLDNVTLSGGTTMLSIIGTYTRLYNNFTISNGSQLLLTSPQSFLSFAHTQTLGGGGGMQLGATARVVIEGNATLTLGTGTTIRGSGLIGDQLGTHTFVNNGIVRSETAGSVGLAINAASFVNNGLAEAGTGLEAATLRIASPFTTNNGQIIARPLGTVNAVAPLSNSASGVITADGGTVNLSGVWTNAGVIRAINNGVVILGGTFSSTNATGLTSESGGQIRLAGVMNVNGTYTFNASNPSWHFAGGTIAGGTLGFADGQQLLVTSGGGTLRDVHVTSGVQVASESGGQPLTVAGSTHFDGVLEFLPSSGGSLYFSDASETFSGNVLNPSRIEAQSFTLGLNGSITTGNNFTLDSDSFVNQGRVTHAGGAGTHFQMAAPVFDNQGLIEVTGGGRLKIGMAPSQGATVWQNSGTIRAINSVLELDGVYDSQALAGVDLQNSQIKIAGNINNAGNVFNISTAATQWVFDQAVVRGGSMAVAPGAVMTGILELDNTPTVTGSISNTSLAVRGGLALSGVYSASGVSVLSFLDGQTVTGGEFNLEYPVGRSISVPGNGTLTLSPTTWFHGGNYGFGGSTWTPQSRIRNEGRITADVPGKIIGIGSVDNLGVVEAVNGGILSIGANSLLGGTVRIGENSTLWLGGSLTPGVTLHQDLVWERGANTLVELRGTIENAGRTLTLDGSTGPWVMNDDYGGRPRIRGGVLNLQAGGGLSLRPDGGSPGWHGVLENITVNGDLSLQPRHVGGILALAGTVNLNGTIHVNNNELALIPSGSETTCTVNGGTIVLGPVTRAGIKTMVGTSMVTLSAGTTIRGGGPSFTTPECYIGSNLRPEYPVTLVNYGLISGDVASTEIGIQMYRTVNRGVIEGKDGGRVRFLQDPGYTLDNTNGVLRVSNGGKIELGSTVRSDQLGTIDNQGGRFFIMGLIDNGGRTMTINTPLLMSNYGTIKGGTIEFSGAGSLTSVGQSRLDGVTINGDIFLGDTISGGGALTLRNSFVLNGTLRANVPGGKIESQTPLTLTSGTFAFDAPAGGENTDILSYAGLLTLGSGVTVRGGGVRFLTNPSTGTILNQGLISADRDGLAVTFHTVRFGNEGTIQAINGGQVIYVNPPLLEPGDVPAMTNTGTIALGAGSAFRIDGVLALTPFSTLAVTLTDNAEVASGVVIADGMELGGTFRLSFASGYRPAAGHAFRVLASGDISGAFSRVIAPEPGAGLAWDFSSLGTVGIVRVVPSPGTGLLAGLALFAAVRRRRGGGR